MIDAFSDYTEFIYKRTYSKWDWNKGRREEWSETINRYADFMKENISTKLHPKLEKCRQAIEQKKVMPSMRSLWSAGPALEKNHIANYNCCYLQIDRSKAFAETLYILLCGTGVGFSVERQFIVNLPNIPCTLNEIDKEIVFEDSKEGWAVGFNELINYLYEGFIPKSDLSKIRPEGAILKTFGGRASGPRPLKRLIDFTVNLFKNAKGRKLNSLECHDLVCCICDVVVVGGVRRSSAISLSNLSDNRMKHAKDGAFWDTHPYRMLANNSVAYTEKPDMTTFMEEWLSLARSGTGERGIFNREACENIVQGIGRRNTNVDWGCNPCSEIILRPNSFCNLTEVVVRPNDTLHSLCEKVKLATLLGIIQSTFTDFPFIDASFQHNCDEERLLGVSLTGVCDHPVLSNFLEEKRLADWLNTMKLTAIESATKYSKVMGIKMPAAITCIKPSGTVSQLVDSSSGIHLRHSPYYIRRVRSSRMDPISSFLIDSGVHYNPEVGSTYDSTNTWVFDFYTKSPKSSKFRYEVSALEQLNFWKLYQIHWCEHKPSYTCYVKDDEWLEVGAWIFKNWDIVSGISFLPYDGGVYQLAPFEEITKEKYEEEVIFNPSKLDWSKFSTYETSDFTEGAKEFACTGNTCGI